MLPSSYYLCIRYRFVDTRWRGGSPSRAGANIKNSHASSQEEVQECFYLSI
jgi:hypothetical protein